MNHLANQLAFNYNLVLVKRVKKDVLALFKISVIFDMTITYGMTENKT